MFHVLSLLAALTTAVLLAGCSGGGGTPPPNTQVGTVELTYNDVTQVAYYIPPAGRTPYAVYAYCYNVANAQILSANFHFEYGLNRWKLDLSSESTQFTGTAIGTFNMQVYVVFADDTTTPVKVGGLHPLEGLNVLGNGPPPPPW